MVVVTDGQENSSREFRKDQIEGDTVICVISGGNADPAMFTRALATLP